jgi:hypothetical protein
MDEGNTYELIDKGQGFRKPSGQFGNFDDLAYFVHGHYQEVDMSDLTRFILFPIVAAAIACGIIFAYVVTKIEERI